MESEAEVGGPRSEGRRIEARTSTSGLATSDLAAIVSSAPMIALSPAFFAAR